MPDALSREALIEWFMPYLHHGEKIEPEDLIYDLKNFPSAPFVPGSLPCKIGNRAWTIRNYKGFRRPQEGIISEMCYAPDMRLVIVIKGVARGEWGKSVFATYAEAQNAIIENYG